MSLTVLMLAVALQTGDKPITVTGRVWAPFISPMGEPFRPRVAGDDTLRNWFHQADRDGDGALTTAEMEADAVRFFGTLDTERDGQILPEELVAYETEVAPEIQVNSRWRSARGEPVGDKMKLRNRGISSYDPNDLHGAARYTLLNMPQPVAAADTDFDRAITLAEFRAAAVKRFALLDRNADRKLNLVELRALAPRSRDGKKPKLEKDAPDARVGTSIPVTR